MNDQSFDEQPKNNRNKIIIGVVVAVLLCCCCATVLGAWYYGDQILQALGIPF
jgi:phosphate/sulfate permease